MALAQARGLKEVIKTRRNMVLQTELQWVAVIAFEVGMAEVQWLLYPESRLWFKCGKVPGWLANVAWGEVQHVPGHYLHGTAQ